MKIYWADRENRKAPSAATFQCRSFFPHQSIDFRGYCESIETLPPPVKHLKVKSRYELPHKEQWIQNVEKALSQKLEKIVLARCQVLELEEAPNPFAITAALKTKAQGAFLFCIQKEDQAFLGASPERLFARKGTQLITEAMAGTRPRGKNAQEDSLLQKELLSNEKDLREIVPVQTFLKNRLSPLCSIAPVFTPLKIHQTHNVQHLYSQGLAHLKESISDEEILRAIHPTPALCGAPQEQAFEWIQKLEPFQRGLYGGVIGWSHGIESEWIVAIRSCYIQGKTVQLFSGAGIVQGSDPAQEWEELNHKLKLFDEIFV